jgi:carbonic anhydrase
MTPLDTLIQRNNDFAAHRFTTGLAIMPTLRTMILSCADPRVDPAHLFELAPGEAVVLRNVGGRITPGTLQLMRMLMQVPTSASTAVNSAFTLIVLHHTDCGITRLASNTTMMADYFGIAPEAVPGKAIMDPHAAVAVDVTALWSNPTLPGTLVVSGVVYDVATGRVEVVVPPAPLHENTLNK